MRSICSILVVGLLFLGGCAARHATITETGGEQAIATDSLRFDPLELPRDREVVPQQYPVMADVTGRETVAADDGVTADENSSAVQFADVPVGIDSVNNQAFKVQIFTSKLYGDAKHTKLIADEIFDRPVYLDYEVPYYKVRVGSFADRYEAEDYAQKVRIAGYADAWVVATTTSARQAAPLYDDSMPPLFDDEPDAETEEDNEEPSAGG